MNLKNVAFLMTVFLVQLFHAQSELMLPVLSAKGRTIQEVIPSGWKVLSKASGDLNGDGTEDLIFAVQSPI